MPIKPDKQTLEAAALMFGHRAIKPGIANVFGKGKVAFAVVLGEIGGPGSGLGFCSNIDREDLKAILLEMLRELDAGAGEQAIVREDDIPK